jgi:hypothetical protein
MCVRQVQPPEWTAAKGFHLVRIEIFDDAGRKIDGATGRIYPTNEPRPAITGLVAASRRLNPPH